MQKRRDALLIGMFTLALALAAYAKTVDRVEKAKVDFMRQAVAQPRASVWSLR